MERRERREKENKIKGRRGLFLLLLALVFRPPPRSHFSLSLFAIFVPSFASRSHCAVYVPHVSLPRHEERRWTGLETRVTRLSMRLDTRAYTCARAALAADWKAWKENEERVYARGGSSEAGHELGRDSGRWRYRRMKYALEVSRD